MSETYSLAFGSKDSDIETEISEVSKSLASLGVENDPTTLARFTYALQSTKTRHPSVNLEAFTWTLIENYKKVGTKIFAIAEEKYEKGIGEND